jgi:NADH-quinone oxidoreductase subunit A
MHFASGDGVLFVLGMVVSAVAFIGVVFVANRFLSPRNPFASKDLPFECGVDQEGEAWSASRLRFSALAAIFVLFDAEAVLLFAVAEGLRGRWVAAVEVGAFVLFLAFGLAFAWRKGALEWRM